MAEDPKISQRYRELPREEPSPEVDAAILAAARRATETRPAPLVVPSGRRRWYFPLAAAAIIVLAVAVTIHVERQRPDPELAVPPVTGPEAREEEKPVEPAPARKAAPASGMRESPRSEAAAERRQRDEVQRPPAPEARAMAKLAIEPPEQWLERIAELRKQGKHEEADKALSEFRRAYPDYRLSEEMRAKVEKN